MKSSTTTRSPDFLLVILLLLQHLTSLARILLNSKLFLNSLTNTYSSQTILCLELLDVVERIVDESKTSRSATSWYSEKERKEPTESNLEAKEDDALIVLDVVLLGQSRLKLFL